MELIDKNQDRKADELNQVSRLVADRVDAMLAYWDKDLVCRFANKAYLEWFGKAPEEMIDKMTIQELLGPLYYKNLPFITAALQGKIQTFEREIPLPTGDSRHSIATYFPDIADGLVRGFFVHVADVTPIKLLEGKLREMEIAKKREVIRSIIETREIERENIAYQLRDSISQTLAYCKMMLESEKSKNPGNTLLEEITNNIYKAISELNIISRNLSPSLVTDFGLLPAIEDFIDSFKKQYNCEIAFKHEALDIEKLERKNKISVFRVVQDFLLLTGESSESKTINIKLKYTIPNLLLEFTYNNPAFKLPEDAREMNDIQNRVEYNGGTLKEFRNSDSYRLLIELKVE